MSGGMYCTQCEAAGLPQDHLLARPPRRDGALPGAHRGRTAAGAALERQPARLRRRLGRVGGPVPQALLPLRAGRRRPRARSRTASPPRSGRDGAAADLGARRRRGPLRLRDGRAQALDALGRGGLRPRVRPRPLHDRRRRRLQHGGDGEQGAQHLQLDATCSPAPRPPPTPTTRRIETIIAHEYFHNWTGNRITCRDWFQLSPEGGADGLPRPAVLGRRAQRAASSGSRT